MDKLERCCKRMAKDVLAELKNSKREHAAMKEKVQKELDKWNPDIKSKHQIP